RAARGACHPGCVEDEGPDHAIDPAGVELSVGEVVGVIERDALWLLNAGDDADLMALRVELVDGVVAERVDEDVATPTNEHIIGRWQTRESTPCRVEHPDRAALIGDEDPPARIASSPGRTIHARPDLRRRLAVGGDAPDDAVRAIRYDDVAVRQDGTDAVEAVTSGLIGKRVPEADGVRLRIDGRDTIVALLPDQDPPIGRYDDPLRRRHAASDALDRTVG